MLFFLVLRAGSVRLGHQAGLDKATSGQGTLPPPKSGQSSLLPTSPPCLGGILPLPPGPLAAVAGPHSASVPEGGGNPRALEGRGGTQTPFRDSGGSNSELGPSAGLLQLPQVSRQYQGVRPVRYAAPPTSVLTHLCSVLGRGFLCSLCLLIVRAELVLPCGSAPGPDFSCGAPCLGWWRLAVCLELLQT